MEERLYFRALEYSDLAFLNKIRNDDKLYDLTCGNKYFISTERDRKWIEDKIFNNQTQLYVMICKKDVHTPIGYISATDIDYINRKALCGGIVIDEEFSGRGYALEAANLLVQYLFGELGMNMLYVYVREDHITSLKILEKVGFKKECLLREFIYKRNRFHNVFLLSMLKSEYYEENNCSPLL